MVLTTIAGTLVGPATAEAHQVGHLTKHATLKQQQAFYKANIAHASDLIYLIRTQRLIPVGSGWFARVQLTVKKILLLNRHEMLLRNARRNLAGVMAKVRAAQARVVSIPAGICWACWDNVASCESGQTWNDNTGNGFYGGLQFTISTWLRAGGGRYASRADHATRIQQIIIASKLALSNWPVCGARY